MSTKRGELHVDIVFEGDDEEQRERMRDWLISRLKEAPKGSRLGFIGIAVYDEAGHMVGLSTHGAPTPSAQQMIEEVFGLKETA
jgi:hypothetical protein